jgi:TonB family protein
MNYLLEVTLCWAVFFGIYHLLLRAETFHRTNRWYLLGTLLLGLVIPMLDVNWLVAPTSPVYILQPITVGVQELEAVVITASQQEQGIDYQAVLLWMYWLGVVVSLARFGYGLWQIRQLYRSGDIAKQDSYDLVTTSAPHLPFSFFRNLFWSKNFVTTEEERRSIVRHEEAHIFQKHSHDVVLLELVAAFAWCVPFVYFYKKALKTTHEYLADAYVTAGFDKKQYGRLLLRQSHPGMQVAISNSLFSSQLKKRIVMMTKTKSAQRAALKYLAVLPAVAVLLMAFSLENSSLSTGLELLENQPIENIDMPDSPPSAMALRDTVPVENRLHYVAEMAAQFPGDEGIPNAEGGYDYPNKNLMKFIFDNMRYPAEARDQGIEGMVIAKFVVEKDGSISDIDIKEGALGGGCEEEVKRIISLMPKWNPGTMDGKPVRSIRFLPIKFKLDDKPLVVEAVKPLTISDLDEAPVMLGCESLTGEERQNCSTGKLVQAVFSNVRYPAEARKNGVEGTVYAKFIIEKDGSITKPEIIRSLGSGCDEEVLRVIGLMPKWSPGKKDGQPVAVSFMLPVKFKLDEGQEATKPSEEVILEAFPNPAGSDGFEVRFKAPAGRVSILFYDANAMKEVNEKFFDVEKGQLNTYHIRPESVFANGKTGTAAISLRDTNGKVLATTKVIVQ